MLLNMSAHSVLVVDDDELILAMLRSFIDASPHLAVVGTASSGMQAISLAQQCRPDVVMMDMQMPWMDGVEATRRIHKMLPQTAIIAVSSFATDRYVGQALRWGASGYLVKDTPPTQLVEAIQRAAEGEEILSPRVLKHVMRIIRDEPEAKAPRRPGTKLSDREVEVLQLLARGHSNKEIAQELFLTEATVKSHLTRITARIGVRDRLQAVIRAYEWNLVDLHLDNVE